MSRQEFFRRLEYLLRAIPENERNDALAYYNDYFDEAGVENEQRVIQELGSPEQVAQMILDDYERNRQGTYENAGKQRNGYTEKRSKTERILWIILLVLTSPVWIGILIALFGVVIALLGSLFGITLGIGGSGIGLLVGGFVLLFVGVFRLFISPIEGVVTIGIGAILSAVSILLLLVVCLLFRWLPSFVRAIVTGIRSFLVHRRGGNEI